jgi:CPA1 family monovalent cation:H+ antiporter
VSNHHPAAQLALLAAAVSGVAILGRLLWVFPAAYLPFLLSARICRVEKRPGWQSVLVCGWAGMRGTITLAAALSIPALQADGSPFPGRDMVIFLALAVIVVTLLLNGMTLEWLIGRLGLRADDTRAKEDRLARIAAVESGLQRLHATAVAGTGEEQAAWALVVAEYEHRLAELTASGETRASAHRHQTSGRQHRLHALLAERATIDDLWRRDIIADETHRPLQQLLDHEESLLHGQAGPAWLQTS